MFSKKKIMAVFIKFQYKPFCVNTKDSLSTAVNLLMKRLLPVCSLWVHGIRNDREISKHAPEKAT